jgi:hypothetical protein
VGGPKSHGLTLALDIAGAAPRRQLRKLPVVDVPAPAGIRIDTASSC